jgi:hypothetical protein
MAGPQRARLDQALTGAHEPPVSGAVREWSRCSRIMRTIAIALENASPAMRAEIGGQTGPAIDAAFKRSAEGMTQKSVDLSNGSMALQRAADAMASARAEQRYLDDHPLTEPTPYVPGPGPRTDEDIAKEAAATQAQNDYAAAYADQEARAKAKADHMDQVYAESTAVMKQIHGVPDREPPDEPTSSGGTGGGGGGAPFRHPVSGGGGSGSTGHGSTISYPPTDGGHHNGGNHGNDTGSGTETGSTSGTLLGAPQGGLTIEQPGLAPGAFGSVAPSGSTGGTGLGLAGAAAGGIGGGLLGTGLATGGIRGGLTPMVTGSGTAASGVRGIGATSRSGAAGTLGRSGAAGTGATSTGRGSAARSSGVASGRGTTGRGAGSRGAAGGRGTGSAGGRGGRKKDEKKGRRDAFDTVAEDWLDDDEAAPGVLD